MKIASLNPELIEFLHQLKSNTFGGVYLTKEGLAKLAREHDLQPVPLKEAMDAFGVLRYGKDDNDNDIVIGLGESTKDPIMMLSLAIDLEMERAPRKPVAVLPKKKIRLVDAMQQKKEPIKKTSKPLFDRVVEDLNSEIALECKVYHRVPVRMGSMETRRFYKGAVVKRKFISVVIPKNWKLHKTKSRKKNKQTK